MNVLCKTLISGIAAVFFLTTGPALAAERSKKEARVTRVIREVNVLPSEASARPAVVNENVTEGTGVRTGDSSRSELTFPDLTITRLGENTIFSFNKAGRNAQLSSGSILLRVPKDSGGANIITSGVTAGITGTTVIFEFTRAGRSKLIVLEGTSRLTLVRHRDQTASIHAGQMLDVPAGATKMPPPVNIDLDQLMKTSPLITDFPPLPSQPLILAAIRDQRNSGAGETVYQGQPAGDLSQGPFTGLPGFPGGLLGGYPGGPSGGVPPRHGRPGGRPSKGSDSDSHPQTKDNPQPSPRSVPAPTPQPRKPSPTPQPKKAPTAPVVR